MNVIIEGDYLKDLYAGVEVKGKPKFGEDIIRGFRKKVALMKNASNSNDLRNLKSLHFEKLSGNLNGKYSVRINNAYRIIFRMEPDGNNVRVEIIFIEDLSNHYS
ncbi:type II toxin-antitoxin system RelE/ParE family toxin [Mucilaginibacter sp.]|uniref:type II toxin-antitoxin system RelE/ParE family toxin n=1 Tax=Mucilaginibacter sp. TaxID=1882438 RepID=UPI003D0F4AD6